MGEGTGTSCPLGEETPEVRDQYAELPLRHLEKGMGRREKASAACYADRAPGPDSQTQQLRGMEGTGTGGCTGLYM